MGFFPWFVCLFDSILYVPSTVGPDLGPSCLQRSAVDDASRQRVNEIKQEKKVDVRFCHSELP